MKRIDLANLLASSSNISMFTDKIAQMIERLGDHGMVELKRDCQRRSKNRPLWRSKSRPLTLRQIQSTGPRSGPCAFGRFEVSYQDSLIRTREPIRASQGS